MTWNDLCLYASSYHLNMTEFEKLASFYERMDKVFFEFCSRKIMDPVFPQDAVNAKYSSPDLEKFLLLCIVSGYPAQTALYWTNQWGTSLLEEIRHDLRVWLDTLLRDIGGYGLPWRIFEWERECLRGLVKPFGRMQCNDIHFFEAPCSIYRRGNDVPQALPAFAKGNPPHPDLTKGDKTINFHIPASGPLRIEDCCLSIKKMCAFVESFHPDYDYKAVVGYSWLFDPVFKQILKPESNIVKFQSLGHLFRLPSPNDDEEVVWRIWGKPGLGIPYEQLPVKSSMERSVARYLADGGHFFEYVLVIFRDELPKLY